MIPIRTVSCRQRPSDPWFDQDCRATKRRVRFLERVSRRAHRVAAVVTSTAADVAAAAAADVAWRSERRAYRDLCNSKREAFWRSKIDAERSSPYQLWQSVDTLMGGGLLPHPR